MTAEPVSARRRVIAGVGAAVAAVLLTSACAAGQQAQTANQKPTLDGTNATIGSIGLRGLAIEAPSGPSYAVGSNPAIKVVLVNSGLKADALTSISSSEATGWGTAPGTSGTGASSTSPVSIAAGDRVSYGVPEATDSLLLLGTKAALYPGTSITLTFTFAKAGSVSVQVPVHLTEGHQPASYVPAPSGASAG